MAPIFWNTIKAVLLTLVNTVMEHLTGTGSGSSSNSNGTDKPQP